MLSIGRPMSDQPRPRRGLILYLVLFVLMVLSIFTLAYHQAARQGRQFAFRLEQSDVARQLAEATMETAERYLDRESANPDSAIGQWLMAHDGTAKAIPVGLVTREAATMVRADMTPVIGCQARVIDFRNTDSKNNKYYGQEGVGTIEIRATSVLQSKNTGAQIGSCEFIRHHDFKVASIVSKASNTTTRNQYAANWTSDYALFVRNGLREFHDSAGYSVNNYDARLQIDQRGLNTNQMGKIHFGDAAGNGSDRVVFGNINQKFAGLIPAMPLTTVKTLNTSRFFNCCLR